MRSATQNPFSPMTLVVGLSGIFLGLTTGYIMGAGQVQVAPRAVAAAGDDHVHTTGDAGQAHLVNEEELKAFKDILKQDPRNVKAAIEIGNRLYDGNRFAEAIPYYRQALELEPANVNVSTDLGTALYYAGLVDEALLQFDASLKMDPRHAQTYFNIGIVRRDAKKDVAGAVSAWEQLLAAEPAYPEAARVRAMIAEIRKG